MSKSSRKQKLTANPSDSELQRLERALDIILSLDHQIFHESSFDLNKLLGEMLKGLCDITKANYAQILLRRGSSLQITHSTQPNDKGLEFKISECVCGLAVQKQKTISSGDVGRDYPKRYKWVLGVNQKNRMKSEVAVPVRPPIVDPVVTGVINIESPQPNAFSKDIEKLVERMALQAGAAIHTARLQAGLGLTFQLTESIEIGQLSPYKALRNTLRQIAEFFRDGVVVQFLLYNPTTDTLRIESSTVESTEGQRVLVSDSFSGIVVREGRAILSKDVRKEYPEHFKDTVGDAVARPTRSELAVPVFEDEHIIGVLNVENSHKNAFDEHDQYVLSLFASNARLWKRVSHTRRTQALEKMATIGDVAANMFHILRSDLVSLRTLANEIEKICSTADTPPPITTHLEELRSIAASAIKRSQDVQEKYERAQRSPEKIYLNRMAREIIEKVITRGEIKYQLDERMPAIIASPAIWDVIWNLVSNSQKAMIGRPLQVLTVGTKVIMGQYTNQIEAFELSVTDTGKGIPEDMKEKIFQLGVSEDGSGWGLWLVENFVERWHGRIYLQTECGKGTNIRLWFPLTIESGELKLKGGQ